MVSTLIIIPIVIILLIFLYNKKINPHKKNNIIEMYAEGLDMLVSGKRIAAYNNFKSIIKKDSNNIKSYIRLGQVLREGGSPGKALKIHKSLLLRKRLSSHELIELHKNIALNYFSLDNFTRSILEAKKILAIEKDNDWAIRHLITLYKMENNWKESTEFLKLYFDKTGKKDNHKLALYKVQNARMEIHRKNFKESREILERALNIDDSFALVYYFMGKTYSEESNVDYDKAIELDKKGLNSLKDKEVYNTYVENAKKILSKAIPMWTNFLELDSDNSWLVLPLLKDALYALDRYSEVEDILSKLLNLYPDNIEILASLADYYSNKGEISKAIQIIDKVVSNNKNYLLIKLIRLKLTLQNSEDKKSVKSIDDIINIVIKDTASRINNDKKSNADIKWIFNNNDISLD